MKQVSESLPYDKTSPISIESFAKELLNTSLSEALGNKIVETQLGKGRLGQMVEELYFGYKPNSDAHPDFTEAGVELKTTPLKKIKKGLVSKERLVFNIINYEEEVSKTFETSSFWQKNKLLLLMFFLHESDKGVLDYVFKIITLWEFPQTDLKIIKDDWLKIVNKIKDGKAHELSEGDTFYLGACTKGATKESLRTQPYSTERAMQRAFSLKSKYLNFIIEKKLTEKEFEPVVKDINQYNKNESFEDLVTRMFKPFLGLSIQAIANKLRIEPSTAKSRFYFAAKSILEVKRNKIEEFEKGDVMLKTIRFGKTGTLKESMSFAQIQFKEIIDEEWEESYWFNTLTKRFFFVIFKNDKMGDPILERVLFWTMPTIDLEQAKTFWEDTKERVVNEDFENFIKISDDRMCHVRPKGTNSKDLMETAAGNMEKKKCYWLNSKYIKSIVNA